MHPAVTSNPLMELYAQYLCKSIDPERFGGRSSDETSCRDLACEARDMRDGKDAFASLNGERRACEIATGSNRKGGDSSW